MPRLRPWFATSAFLLLAGALGACGTDAMGTDACRKIEEARCRRGPQCPDLHVQAGTGVEECTQFARDRCLHGFAVADPGPAVVDRCVAAIDSAACDLVLAPENLPACSFLLATPPTDEGGIDAPEAAAEIGSSDDGGSADAG